MKNVMLILLAAYLTGCAAAPVRRTKNSDPTMRVAIDAGRLFPKELARLQNAIYKSHAFVVVDRGQGFAAIDREQRRQHVDQTDRFSPEEKYARFAKLYGVAAIITATDDCRGFRGLLKNYYVCTQNLALVNATTGEVMATGESKEESQAPESFNWENSVEKLIENLPTHMVDNSNPNLTTKYTGPQVDYRKKNAEADAEAKRVKEQEFRKKVAAEEKVWKERTAQYDEDTRYYLKHGVPSPRMKKILEEKKKSRSLGSRAK